MFGGHSHLTCRSPCSAMWTPSSQKLLWRHVKRRLPVPLVHALCFRYEQVLATIGWWSGTNTDAHRISEHDGGDPLQWLQHPVHSPVPYLRHEVYKLWVLQHRSGWRMQGASGAAVTDTHIMCYWTKKNPPLFDTAANKARLTTVSLSTNGFSINVSQNPNSWCCIHAPQGIVALLLACPTIPSLQWLWSAELCPSACDVSLLLSTVMLPREHSCWVIFPFGGAVHHTQDLSLRTARLRGQLSCLFYWAVYRHISNKPIYKQ